MVKINLIYLWNILNYKIKSGVKYINFEDIILKIKSDIKEINNFLKNNIEFVCFISKKNCF